MSDAQKLARFLAYREGLEDGEAKSKERIAELDAEVKELKAKLSQIEHPWI